MPKVIFSIPEDSELEDQIFGGESKYIISV